MKSKQQSYFFLLIFCFIYISLLQTTHARNGFIPHYVGGHGLTGGAGGSGTSFTDGSGVVTNPAILSFLDNHVILLAGLMFNKQYADTSRAPLGNPIGKQKNEHDNTLIGTLGASYRFHPSWTAGLGVSGGGGEVKFKDSLTNPARLTPANSGFDTEAVNNVVIAVPSVAYKPTPNQSYGLGLIVGYSNFRSDLAKATLTKVDEGPKRDVAFGLGARIGGVWNFNSHITLGASVSTPVFFQKHKKYDDLFVSAIQIPPTLIAGFAWHMTENTDLFFDVKEIFYGNARWLRSGLGWRNQTIFLVGIQHQWNEDLIIGIGYNYGASPINEDKVYFNATFIPLEEHHISGGIRYKFMEDKELVLIGFYTPKNKLTDRGPIPVFNNATLEDTTFGFEAGLTVYF